MSGRGNNQQQQQFQDQQHMQYMQQQQPQQHNHQQPMDPNGNQQQNQGYSSLMHNMGNQGMPVAICNKHDQVVNAYCKAHALPLCNPCTQEHLSVQMHQGNDIVNINMAVNDNMQMMEAHLKDFQGFYEFKNQVRVDLFKDQHLAHLFIQNSQAFDELLNSVTMTFKQFLNMSAGQQAMNLSQITMQFMSECQKMAGVRGVIDNLNSMNHQQQQNAPQQQQQQVQQQQQPQQQQTSQQTPQNQQQNINPIQQQSTQQQQQQFNNGQPQQQQMDTTKLPSLASVNQEIQQNFGGPSGSNGAQNTNGGNMSHPASQKAPQSPPQQQMNNNFQNAPNQSQQQPNMQDMNVFFDQQNGRQSNNNNQQVQSNSASIKSNTNTHQQQSHSYPLTKQQVQQNTPSLPIQQQQQQQPAAPCQLPPLNQHQINQHLDNNRTGSPPPPLQDTDFFNKQGQPNQEYRHQQDLSNPESLNVTSNTIKQQQPVIPQLDSFAVATQNIPQQQQQQHDSGNHQQYQQLQSIPAKLQQSVESTTFPRPKHQKFMLFVVLKNLICNRTQGPVPQFIEEGYQYRWQIQVPQSIKVQSLKKQVRELVFKNFAFESYEQSQDCGKQLDNMQIFLNNVELGKQNKALHEYGVQENDELVFTDEPTMRGDSRLNDFREPKRERDPSPTNFLASKPHEQVPSMNDDLQTMKLPKINDATPQVAQATAAVAAAAAASQQAAANKQKANQQKSINNQGAKDPQLKKAKSAPSKSSAPAKKKEPRPKKEIVMKTIFFRIRDLSQKAENDANHEAVSQEEKKDEEVNNDQQAETQNAHEQNREHGQEEERHDPPQQDNEVQLQAPSNNNAQQLQQEAEKVYPYQIQFNATKQMRLKQFKKQILVELGMQDQCHIRLYKDDKAILDSDTELIQDLGIDDGSKIEAELFMRLTVSVMNKGSGYVNQIEVVPEETMDTLRQKVPFFRLFTSRGYSIICEKPEIEFKAEQLGSTLFKDSGLTNGATIVLKPLRASVHKSDVKKFQEQQAEDQNMEQPGEEEEVKEDQEMKDEEDVSHDAEVQEEFDMDEAHEEGEAEMEEMEHELEGLEDDMYGQDEEMQQLYGKMMQSGLVDPAQLKLSEEEFNKQIQGWQKMAEAMQQKNEERAAMKKQLEKHDDMFAFNDEDVEHVQEEQPAASAFGQPVNQERQEQSTSQMIQNQESGALDSANQNALSGQNQ